ncbi:MAG: group III truncated hemoglobin [Imperialibacter sp.]|uniref:group III truncated hemoglobin n=1 Tax=Imperialibacter sp. TaxID=2038411 RepID=UPI0032EAF2F0
MKRDITSRADIEKLVDQFNSKVRIDNTIGYIFTDIAALDFARHMPTMYKFWETTLLGVMSYKGNPMSVHIQLDKKEPLKKEHFDRWLELWTATVDDLFEGSKAEEAKTRASQIRNLMQYKVEQSR